MQDRHPRNNKYNFILIQNNKAAIIIKAYTERKGNDVCGSSAEEKHQKEVNMKKLSNRIRDKT